MVMHTIDTTTSLALKNYQFRVKQLFSCVEAWALTKFLQTEYGDVQLNEEAYGSYKIQTLKLFAPGQRQIAELVPVGASIIGAKGRVDLVGMLDQHILVDWDQGGPMVMAHVITEGQDTRKPRQLYRDVTEAGWYWVESRKLARAYPLDSKTFFDLLFAVSGYDCRN